MILPSISFVIHGWDYWLVCDVLVGTQKKIWVGSMNLGNDLSFTTRRYVARTRSVFSITTAQILIFLCSVAFWGVIVAGRRIK